MQIHGGEGKTKDTKLDFSVNISPLGMPKAVRAALQSIMADPSVLETYPDRTCGDLLRAAAGHYRVPEDWIVCGCGASELIYKIAGQYRGSRALVVAPGFGEYEKALREAGSQVYTVELKRERNFAFDEDFLERFYLTAERMEQSRLHTENLPEDLENLNPEETGGRSEYRHGSLVFLCSPNNPVGGRIPEDMLREILTFCMQRGIRAVVDECFLPFVTGEESTIDFLKERSMGEDEAGRRGREGDTGASGGKKEREKEFPVKEDERAGRIKGDGDGRNVCAWPILLKALTKSHGIPGVRLGLAVSPDTKLIRTLQDTGAPWTVSGIAQVLGRAAFEGWDEEEFASMRKMVAEERAFLAEGLAEAGARVYPGEGNFILFSVVGGEGLYEFMRSRGILIRSCKSFGLGADFYRIAVRKREENMCFMRKFRNWADMPALKSPSG